MSAPAVAEDALRAELSAEALLAQQVAQLRSATAIGEVGEALLASLRQALCITALCDPSEFSGASLADLVEALAEAAPAAAGLFGPNVSQDDVISGLWPAVLTIKAWSEGAPPCEFADLHDRAHLFANELDSAVTQRRIRARAAIRENPNVMPAEPAPTRH